MRIYATRFSQEKKAERRKSRLDSGLCCSDVYLVSFYHQSCMQTVYGTLAVHARLIFFVNIVFRKSKL